MTETHLTETALTVTQKWNQIAPLLPDITGWRVLAVSDNYALSAAILQHGAEVRSKEKSLYDAASTWETYDLVVCFGILDTMRYPVLGLDIAVRKSRRLLALETQMPVSLLADAGLRVLESPGSGLYLCELGQTVDKNSGEYADAVGLSKRLARTLRFKHCWVNSVPGYTETCYYDGTRVTATPEDSEQYRANTAAFGYGTDTAALSREHEILHTFLAEKLGFGSSPTLWAVAHEQSSNVAPVWEQEEEESWTLAFQSYLHGGSASEALQRFSAAELDINVLRDEALELLR